MNNICIKVKFYILLFIYLSIQLNTKLWFINYWQVNNLPVKCTSI